MRLTCPYKRKNPEAKRQNEKTCFFSIGFYQVLCFGQGKNTITWKNYHSWFRIEDHWYIGKRIVAQLTF